jgi:DNA-binding response OmpR family regulator
MDTERARILLADDDDDLRRTIAAWLASDGHDIVEITNGADALFLLAAAADGECESPDVLVLDFHMPELSGIGILRTLRRFGMVPPTIIVTGFPDPSVDAFAREAGAFCVLHKPIDGEALRAAVASALRAARAPRRRYE